MLHLWNLAVEEQFYIIWPLILWLSWKRKYNLLTVTIFITLVSLLPSRNESILAVFLSILLAWATYKFIEKPIRSRPVNLRYSLILIITLLILASMSFLIYFLDGIKFRAVAQSSTISPRLIHLGKMSPMKNECGLKGEARKKIAECFTDQRKPI